MLIDFQHCRAPDQNQGIPTFFPHRISLWVTFLFVPVFKVVIITVVIIRAAGIVAALQPHCEEVEERE